MGKEIDAAINRSGYLAKRSYISGLGLLFISVAASASGGLLGLLHHDSQVVGVIALLPGFATLFASTFKFQDKANWYYTRKDHLYDLHNLLFFSGPADTEQDAPAGLKHIEALAEHWNKINHSLSETWRAELNIDWQGARGLEPDLDQRSRENKN
ncbi:MAG TPA: hypothetical protein VEK73_00335 [Xanthobacteraceae bacterium]|nr:hypothetical protein [Xanthobacteraceae bacterium]